MVTTNPIDPGLGGSQSAQSRQQLNSQYSDFLRLLTTQLQHQDPTDPTDTNDLTQQIATLSSVEQGINMNKNLETMIAMMGASQYNNMVAYIGKQIESPGNQGALENGKGLFMYYLAAEATTVTVKIKNETGDVVYEGEGLKKNGRNQFVWDGKNNNGEAQPDGIYTMEVTAKDASNNAITAQTYTTGVVTSIDSVNGIVYASIGNILSIPLTSILSVRQYSEITPPAPAPAPPSPEPSPAPGPEPAPPV